MADDCIFCKIVKGAIPSYKIYENEHLLVILDAFPATEYHTLVIPKKHYMDLIDLPADVGAAILPVCSKVTKALINLPGIEGVNLIQNSRPASGQVVLHTHFHLIPRKKDDHLFKFPGSKGMIEAELGKKHAEALTKGFNEAK